MNIVKYRKIFFAFSILLIAISIAAVSIYGLNLGTDFTGGTLVEIEYQGARPAISDVQKSLTPLSLGAYSMQLVGDKGVSFKLKNMSETEKDSFYKALSLDGKSVFKEKQFSEIGPSLGSELRTKGIIAVGLVVILIVLYIWFVFRQVSRHHVKSWKYGVTAIVALVHDIAISCGAMALLGHFFGAEADALFLTALLTVLGLSVNDTIVVFDRIRENLNRHSGKKFAEVAGISIDETIIRSINTTLTVIITLLALMIFGPTSTKFFAAVLLAGMTAGTYSSIFVAANCLVEWEAWQTREQIKKAK